MDLSGIQPSALRRMSGNTFNLACSTTFMVFLLAHLRRRGAQELRKPVQLNLEGFGSGSDAEYDEDVDGTVL